VQWLDDLLTQYGSSIGMDNFQSNHAGVAGLDFENGDQLIFEGHDEGLLVSMIRMSQGYELATELQKALLLCHYRAGSSYPIQPGLQGDDHLSLSIYLPRDEAGPSNVEAVVTKLRATLEAVFE
jgi:type III secretion system chaperone SycN